MLAVERTGQRPLWPPEVAETALTLKNLHRQYIHKQDSQSQ